MTAPADRAALEWALALADRVIALTVGPPAVGDVLDWALGRGATEAARVWDPALGRAGPCGDGACRHRGGAPGRARRRRGGRAGLAGATGALPALLAAHLGWPLVDGAIRLGREEGELVVERRLSGGRREELAIPCPAVVTVAADSAEPRYVSVKARRAAACRGHATWSLGGPPAHARRRCGPRSASTWDRWTGRGHVRDARRRAPPARSAAERLRQLVGGGAGPASAAAAPESRLVEGDPRAVADRILTFLEQNGFA